MQGPHQGPAGPSALRLASLGAPLLAALLATACQGGPEKRELTDEERLELYVTTATYLYEDGSYVRAQDQAVKALELDPVNVPMRRMIGWVRLHMGEVGDVVIAERFFRDLIRDGEQDTTTLIGLATALERMGVAHNVRSQELASSAGEDERVAAQAQRMAGRARSLWEESLAIFESTLNEGEGSTQAMNGLQRVNALLGRYEESLSWSEQLLERSRGELEAWRRMLRSEDLTEREEHLLRTNERIALDLQIQTQLFAATLLNRLDRPAEAIASLEHALELGASSPAIFSQRAQLYGKTGDHAAAIEDIDRYLRGSELPFEHPDIQRAFELRSSWEEAAAVADAGSG